MRFFDLFLRRAGVDRATAQGRRRGVAADGHLSAR